MNASHRALKNEYQHAYVWRAVDGQENVADVMSDGGDGAKGVNSGSQRDVKGCQSGSLDVP